VRSPVTADGLLEALRLGGSPSRLTRLSLGPVPGLGFRQCLTARIFSSVSLPEINIAAMRRIKKFSTLNLVH
jgi:hypothetical protein